MLSNLKYSDYGKKSGVYQIGTVTRGRRDTIKYHKLNITPDCLTNRLNNGFYPNLKIVTYAKLD